MDSSSGGRSTRRKGIDEFGTDVLRRIFSRLPPISLAYCNVVCTSWHTVINSSPSLWRSAYFLDHTRLKPRRMETASSQEKPDADRRTCYVDEEQRTRLAHGRVSVRKWKAHSGRVNCCRMVMGQIVSGSSDQLVRVWCANTLKCLEQYKVPEKAPVVQVEFDESKVLGAAGKDVLVWSRRGNRRLLRRMGGHSDICSMCVADSDLAVGCIDGTVRMFDLYSSRCTQMFREKSWLPLDETPHAPTELLMPILKVLLGRLHIEPVKAVVMDMATQTMASGSNDGTVQLFDARSGQKIKSLLRPSSMTGITCLQLSAVDHKLFAGAMGGDVYCFDLRSQKTLWKTRGSGGALTCMHSPVYSSSTIGVGGVDGGIRVFSVDSAERIASFQAKPSRLPSSPVLSMALGLTKLVSCHADSSMLIWQFGESRSVVEVEEYYGRREVVALP